MCGRVTEGHGVPRSADGLQLHSRHGAIDRLRFEQLDEQVPGASTAFRAGYTEEFGPHEVDVRLAAFYRMCGNLELCDVAARHFTATEAAQYRATTLAAMRRYG